MNRTAEIQLNQLFAEAQCYIVDSPDSPTVPNEDKLEIVTACVKKWASTTIAEYKGSVLNYRKGADGKFLPKSEPVPEDDTDIVFFKLLNSCTKMV